VGSLLWIYFHFKNGGTNNTLTWSVTVVTGSYDKNNSWESLRRERRKGLEATTTCWSTNAKIMVRNWTIVRSIFARLACQGVNGRKMRLMIVCREGKIKMMHPCGRSNWFLTIFGLAFTFLAIRDSAPLFVPFFITITITRRARSLSFVVSDA
jgi:hypothetical protein